VTLPILAVLALGVVQASLGTLIDYAAAGDPTNQIVAALGPRDTPPPATVYAERCRRAYANFQETLPAFLALALLHQIGVFAGDIDGTAVMAAWAYFGMRVAYVPAYLSGVIGVRSVVWTGALVALLAMAGLLVTG
jgi:uncharacterized MAPEG superfamily protein